MLAKKMMPGVSLNEAINKQKNNDNFNVLQNVFFYSGSKGIFIYIINIKYE